MPTAMREVTNLPVTESFRAHPSSLYQVRQFVRRQAERADLSGPATDDLLLAVSEACVNAVLHTASSAVRVGWREQDGCVEVQVRDEGIFNKRVPMGDPEEHGGRGILLMMAVMDEVAIREGSRSRPGTVVRLVKCDR